MKRNKILAAIAVTSAMLALAGCGNKTDSDTSDDVNADNKPAVTKTTEASENTDETAAVEATTEAPTEAEPESEGMTFAEIEDVVDKILSGKTDTLDDMVATLDEYNFEFDKDKEDSWDGPEFSYTANYFKTPINVTDIDGISIKSIYIDKWVKGKNTIIIDCDVKGNNRGENHNSYVNFYNYLIDNKYTHENEAEIEDRIKFATDYITAPMENETLYTRQSNDKFSSIYIMPKDNEMTIQFEK